MFKGHFLGNEEKTALPFPGPTESLPASPPVPSLLPPRLPIYPVRTPRGAHRDRNRAAPVPLPS
eukprot:1273481-Pyramimonas_sp.AAC.1